MDERSSLRDEFPQQYGIPQHEAMFASPAEADAPLNDDWAILETSPTPPHQPFVLLLRLATVAAFALIIATVIFFGSLVGNTAQATTAQQVIAHAVQTLEHGDFQSLNITEQELNGLAYPSTSSGGFGSEATPVAGDLKPYGDITYLYQTPNLWRVDTVNQSASSTSDSSNDTTSHSVALSDGSTYWEYFISNISGQSFGDIMHQTTLTDLSYIKNGRSALTRIFQTNYYSLRYIAVCGSPVLQGSEAVNGRDAYVISYEPYYSEAATPTPQCAQLEKQLNQEQNDEFSSESGSGGVMTRVGSASPGISGPTNNGPKPTYRMWVDKQTFLVLKTEETGEPDGKPIRATEVTNLQVNTAIDAKQFTAYDKPTNSTVGMAQGMTATEETDFPTQANAAAKAADYPVFIPNYLPAGVVPIKPDQSDSIMAQAQHGVSFSFAPSMDLGKDIFSLHSILTIAQHHATYADIAQAQEQGKPIDVGGSKGWLSPPPVAVSEGTLMSGTIGAPPSVSFVRDGTFIQVSGSAYSSDELVKIAIGLQAAPNSHTPLPTPQPPTIAQVRQQSKSQVFVPTDLPAGVAAEPPIAPQLSGATSVSIIYHNHDGSLALALEELDMTGLGSEFSQIVPSGMRQQVTMSSGITATYIPIFPFTNPGQEQYNGSWFIWSQGASTIILIGPGMSKADFEKIANSMSATADLGTVELPPSPRPNLTVAPPGFTVLHPTSLPKGLQPQERTIPAPDHAGSGVTITYAPSGDSLGMNSLLLVEMPAAAAGDMPNDPKATQEQIAGHKVSVSRDKNTCEMMTWQQDGVYFALINPVISGMNSQYTYAQMQAMIESLK